MQRSIIKLSRGLIYPNVLIIIILCCLGILIYSNTFQSSFHFDDDSSVINNSSISRLSNLKAIWGFWPTRFITYLSIALNYHFGQFQVFGYHLFNLIVHLICSVIFWWFALLTFSTNVMKNQKISHQAQLLSLCAGLIFLAHPIQTQAVTYIIQRATSLTTLFYLLSLCFYIKFRLHNQENLGSGTRIFYYSGALVAALTAAFCKEISITLPFALLLYELCFLKNKKGSPFKYILPFLLIVLIIPLTMLLSKSVNFKEMRVITEGGLGISHPNYFFTQFRVLITYIRLFFLPIKQNLDYDYSISKTLLEFPTLVSLLFLLIILAAARKLFSKYRIISFSIFWFFLTLAPESGIIPIRDVIFEHRLYLAMPGFSLFLVSILYYLLGNKNLKLIRIILFLLISGYCVLTYQRNLAWKDELTLWNDVVQKSPRKARGYNNRGFAYQEKGDFDLAVADFTKAIQINPDYADAYNNRGVAYKDKGDLVAGVSEWLKAVEINPNLAEAYNNLANAYGIMGKTEEAIANYTKAIRIKPGFAPFYHNRGNAYQHKGNFDLAAADFNKAKQISAKYAPYAGDKKPTYFLARKEYYESAADYYNRGLTYQKEGNLDRAIAFYDKAIESEPAYTLAYNNRGIAYSNKVNFNQAIADFTKAIEIDPKYAEAFYNRGLTYKKQGSLDKAVVDFNRAIEINPKLASAYYNRSQVYFLQRKYDQAWEDVHQQEALGYKVNPDFLKKLKQASGKEG